MPRAKGIHTRLRNCPTCLCFRENRDVTRASNNVKNSTHIDPINVGGKRITITIIISIIIRKNTHFCVNHARVSQRADDQHDGEEESRRWSRQRFHDRPTDSILIGMTKMPRSAVLLHRRHYNFVVLSHPLFLCLCFCPCATSLLPFSSFQLLLNGFKWKVSKLKTLEWVFNWVGEFYPIGLSLYWRRRRTTTTEKT